ncbi:hypothetical protein GQ600_191 [Phytophthora cactorum]|nr:hypothetical protein GQ600_191 [Phytophthora cactorum]
MDQRAVYHPYDESYAALVKMLEMNRTLEYLDIVAQRPHLTHYDNFKAHHFEALPVTQSVLSMNCKAASSASWVPDVVNDVIPRREGNYPAYA